MAMLAMSLRPVNFTFGRGEATISARYRVLRRYVFCTTMLGNFAEWSSCRLATPIATFLAIAR